MAAIRGTITRSGSALTPSEALAIIKSTDYGVLATVNARGEPSVVALNHLVVDDSTIVFHCGRRGEKVENIKVNPAVSFFVTGSAELVPEQFETLYTSAVAHGKAEIIEEEGELRRYLQDFLARFVGEAVPLAKQEEYIEKGIAVVAVIKLHITQLTGKSRPGKVE